LIGFLWIPGLFQKLTGRFVFKDNGFGFFFWYWIFFQSTSATKVKLLGEPDNGRTALFDVYGYYRGRSKRPMRSSVDVLEKKKQDRNPASL
jgi:hypothetical protein